MYDNIIQNSLQRNPTQPYPILYNPTQSVWHLLLPLARVRRKTRATGGSAREESESERKEKGYIARENQWQGDKGASARESDNERKRARASHRTKCKRAGENPYQMHPQKNTK